MADLDPDLLALLDDVPPVMSGGLNDIPMLSQSREASGLAAKDASEVDLTEAGFPEIKEFSNKKPHTLFDTAEFYKQVLAEESDRGQRIHALLTKYLPTKDPKDRSVYRQQLITAYWNLISHIALKAASGTASQEKKYALRFGMLLPTLLTPEQKDIFAKVIDENTYNQPIYYLDEWFGAIGAAKIAPSSTDEVKVKKSDDALRFQQLYSKAQGKLQSAESLLRAKSDERLRAEDAIKQKIDGLFTHETIPGIPGVKEGFNAGQKRSFTELSELLRKLSGLDKELQNFLASYQSAEADVRTLKERVETAGDGTANVSGAESEFTTIRQMIKMSCGRQGNHFPILTREYFRSSSNEIGTRENVLNVMRWIESIDPEAYCRQYRQQLNRIPPFVILLPSYGDIGFCWEPFDRYNRITSRGRIGIPMYPKNIKIALLTATADLRWQVAKEKASYYWMEEGLTGNYYQWVQAQKLKGDIKEHFINDYLLWMLKESEGIQKLDKEVRNIFWRYMPFAQHVKDELKNRAAVYQELCQKDLNRQMSDGY
ncbi:hypothetical protein [Treponema phagedenis]|uniref:hypothetical protein n=1 Tax=Treponema phagedenis TaxID=162 RepID=UPI0011F01600|nr:hypothetical protein [Treponema phagedenis]TYT78855.1 hypothetical protein FS559_06870 [Treponema phagedenis]